MAERYEVPSCSRVRKLTLDMSGCECLGYKPYAPQGSHPRESQTICFGCRRPVGQCAWLLDRKPYKGSKYYWWEPVYSNKCRPYVSYIIVSCPNYIAPK